MQEELATHSPWCRSIISKCKYGAESSVLAEQAIWLARCIHRLSRTLVPQRLFRQSLRRVQSHWFRAKVCHVDRRVERRWNIRPLGFACMPSDGHGCRRISRRSSPQVGLVTILMQRLDVACRHFPSFQCSSLIWQQHRDATFAGDLIAWAW